MDENKYFLLRESVGPDPQLGSLSCSSIGVSDTRAPIGHDSSGVNGPDLQEVSFGRRCLGVNSARLVDGSWPCILEVLRSCDTITQLTFIFIDGSRPHPLSVP